MRRAAVVFVALLALAAPAAAYAHAVVRSTQPAYLERFEHPPRTVWVRFDQGVKAFTDSIVVRSSNGVVVSGPTRSDENGHRMTTTLRKLPRGALAGNRFELLLRDVDGNRPAIEARLRAIADQIGRAHV